VANDIVLREVDRVRVKGRLQTIRIYEPLAEASAAISAGHRKAIQSYEKGLHAYRQQKWDEAAAEFRETLNTLPDDGPARVMSSRCRGFRENPPPKDWDGVFQQLTK
jgi:adenylate cyclase